MPESPHPNPLPEGEGTPVHAVRKCQVIDEAQYNLRVLAEWPAQRPDAMRYEP